MRVLPSPFTLRFSSAPPLRSCVRAACPRGRPIIAQPVARQGRLACNVLYMRMLCAYHVNEAGHRPGRAMERKTARLTLLIDPRKKKLFEEICAAQDLTPSQVVRRLIRQYVIDNAGSRKLPPWLADARHPNAPEQD